MSNIDIKTVELTISPKNAKSRAFLDTCVFEPENIEEQNLGNLYITGEITKNSSSSEYLINLLVNTIRKEYYLNTNRSPIESLEQSLSKTNEVLADFAEQGNIEWIGNLHMVIAVLKNNNLFFGQTGLAQTFLIRDQNVINIGQDLVIDPKPHPRKTFSNIASGEINPNDKIILATSEFNNIATETKIKNIFSDGVDEYFEQKMETNLGRNINAAVIFLEAARKTTSSGINFIKIPTEPSLGNLGIKPRQELDLRRSQNTSSNFQEEQDRVDEVINELNSREMEIPVSEKIKKTAKTVKFIIESAKKIIIAIYSISRKIILAIYAFLKPRTIALINYILRIISIISHSLSEKIRSVPAFASIIDKLQNTKNFAGEKISGATPLFIKNLSLRTKLIITASIVVLAATGFSTLSYGEKKQEENNMQLYASILETAKNAQKEAEIAEINEVYGDKDKTIELIRTALSSSEKVIQSGYFTEEAQAIKENALKQMDKAEGITRLDEISAIHNFAANSKNINTGGLVWLSKKLYSFNSNNNAIYKYDLEQSSGEIMAVNSKDIGHLVSSKTAKNQIIFLTDLPGIASYEPSKSDIKKLSITFAENEIDIADIAIYKQNSALYTISKNDNEIYKHSSIAAGFAGGEKWIKEPEGSPLSNPVSLAIDGDIYILQNDKTNPIVKFTKGLKSDFSSPEMLISLDEATMIVTDIGMKNLYILDPKNNRVAVISKTGNLVKQFVSKKFDNLISITVDSTEKNIFLLNGTLIYDIEL